MSYFLPTLGSTQPLVKMSTRNIPGSKDGRCVRLTTSPLPCAECHEIWEPKPPGTLWAKPDLLRDCFTITVSQDRAQLSRFVFNRGLFEFWSAHHAYTVTRTSFCSFYSAPSASSRKRLRWSRGSVLAFGTQVRGFKPGRSRRIFQGEKILSTPSFGGEVKPSISCRRFTACKRFLNATWKSGISGKIHRPFLAHIVPLWLLGSLGRRLVVKVGTSKIIRFSSTSDCQDLLGRRLVVRV